MADYLGVRWKRTSVRLKLSLCFVLWMGLFGLGLMIDSSPFRLELLNPSIKATSVESNSGEQSPSASTESSEMDPLPFYLADPALHPTIIANSVDSKSGEDSASESAESSETDESPDFLARLQWHFSLTAILAFAIAMATYTPTNLALLCCLAAVLGSLGRRLSMTSPKVAGSKEVDDAVDEHQDEKIASSLLRGFCVYLLLISGLIVLTGAPFAAPTQDAYIRLAGAASMLCFIAGVRKDFFPKGLKHLGGHS